MTNADICSWEVKENECKTSNGFGETDHYFFNKNYSGRKMGLEVSLRRERGKKKYGQQVSNSSKDQTR